MRSFVTSTLACLLAGGTALAQTSPPAPTLHPSPRLRQLDGHPAMAPKGRLAGPWTKVAQPLREAIAASASAGGATASGRARAGTALRERGLPADADGRTRVTVYVSGLSDAQRALLEATGLRVTFASAEHRFVEGWIRLDDVERLAALDFVTSVQPTIPPITNSGSVNSEGDALLLADQARATFGVSGAGVTVGVISDSVDGIGTAQASGDLPAGVNVLQAGTGSGEGTAMLEIVHDLAPGSPLAFWGPSTSGDMVTGINQLVAAGAKVIVDDLTFFDQPHFEEGAIAQAVNAAAAAGVVYLTSSGNFAATTGDRGHYEATFVDGGSVGNGIDHAHQFAAGDTFQNIVLLPGGFPRIFLQWDDQFGASANDYDLYVATTGGSIVASSVNEQNGDDVPLESVSLNATGLGAPTEFIVVVNRFAGAARRLELYYAGGVRDIVPATAAGSIAGHANAQGAVTVATINADDPGTDTIAAYSSQGPCDITFPAVEARAKPDVTGIDGVAVTGAAGFPNPFFGTSAAAPHVAAVAALMLDANGGLSPAQVKQALQTEAVDLGSGGFDFVFGAGRVDARAAVASVITGGTTTTSLPGGTTTTTVPTGAVCGNSVQEAGETCDDGNVNGGDCCSATCQLDPDDTPCTDDGDACTDDVCAAGTGCAHFLQISTEDVECELAILGFDGGCAAAFDAKTARGIRKLANQARKQLAQAELAATPAKRAKKLTKTAKKIQAIQKKLAGNRAIRFVDPGCLDYLRGTADVLLEILSLLP
jgi:cysteine-rich repeat protein